MPTTFYALGGLGKLSGEISRGLQSSGGAEEFAKVRRLWAQRYRTFARERFTRYARGGGDWAPLAPSTIKRRRKGRAVRIKGLRGAAKAADVRRRAAQAAGGGNPATLWNTGVLLGALDPAGGKAGALEEAIPLGVRVGFGGPAAHDSGGTATIADIAGFHDAGGGRLPQRQIIVPPSRAVEAGMVADVERALQRLAEKNGLA